MLQVSPNEGFRRQLEQYERRLRRPVADATAKRAVRGPVGPARPPHLPEAEDEAPPSIGPQMPPHLQKVRAEEKEETEEKEGDGQKRAEEHAKPAIGPSLPPHLLKRARSPSPDGHASPSLGKKKKKKREDAEQH
jgi:hypothetical protein